MIQSKGEKIFGAFNYAILTLLALVTLYPFLDIIRVSLSTPEEISQLSFRLVPSKIVWDGYTEVLGNTFIWKGYLNTVLRIIIGTVLGMTLTVLVAYPLSKKYLPFRNFFTAIIVFTMFFSGGMIPSYLNIRTLGLMDTIWALVLPMGINTFYMLVMRNFFMAIPETLEEAARIDGASAIQILVRIILPVSMPILMTVTLWTIVDHWNAWFDCLLYIRDPNKFVLQAVLRKIVIDAAPQFDNTMVDASENVKMNAEVVKCSTIVVSTLPIMVVYPFVQKYFVTGVMVGSLKG